MMHEYRVCECSPDRLSRIEVGHTVCHLCKTRSNLDQEGTRGVLDYLKKQPKKFNSMQFGKRKKS